ncbi:hypothetical protein H9660_15380 [Clostridium sp. Sa3CUN1]|uniref:Uncharacterized protein n=1 Tax=Clostridium gallinarum TaxID=2762246 RepID=A0ABR8Q7V7_9CLOT|nr:hypothetical protein [Clostridium gallinarum]MBD7916517.1 hypothetical protein [Clostridium gallinarum]
MKVLFDEDLIATNTYNIMGIPRTIFIDISGNISYDREGIIDEKMLKTNIEKIIQ